MVHRCLLHSCQAGARVVAPLYDELGASKALNVVMVFIDPQEPVSAVAGWRNSFGRPDWMAARDTDGLAGRAQVRVLDTKFLLDGSGVIRDINLLPADEAYLGRIRAVVSGNS